MLVFGGVKVKTKNTQKKTIKFQKGQKAVGAVHVEDCSKTGSKTHGSAHSVVDSGSLIWSRLESSQSQSS